MGIFLRQRSIVVVRLPREIQTILDAILSLKCLQFLKDDLQLTFTFSFLVEKCYFKKKKKGIFIYLQSKP